MGFLFESILLQEILLLPLREKNRRVRTDKDDLFNFSNMTLYNGVTYLVRTLIKKENSQLQSDVPFHYSVLETK